MQQTRRSFLGLLALTVLAAPAVAEEIAKHAKEESKPTWMNPEIHSRAVYGRLMWAKPKAEDLVRARMSFELNFARQHRRAVQR